MTSVHSGSGSKSIQLGGFCLRQTSRHLRTRKVNVMKRLSGCRLSLTFVLGTKITLALAMALIAPAPAGAADIAFNGSTSTDWNTAANWNGGVLPGSGGNAGAD